jgi:Holliday junction resolvasome RuvABC endonuclease subunit
MSSELCHAMIVGINATKGAVFVVEADLEGDNFVISAVRRVEFALSCPRDLLELLNPLGTVLNRLGPDDQVALLKCSSGPHASSVQAIKAETVAELVLIQRDVEVVEIAPQSLKKALTCAAGQDWRQRSKELLNPNGEHQYWTQGANGAAAAAYALATR